MRIFLIAAKAAPDTMESHVLATLKSMGHTLEHFNINRVTGLGNRVDYAAKAALRLIVREPERLHEQALCAAVVQFAPELVIVLQGSAVSPKTVAQLRRRYQGKIVCWCQDALVTMDRQYLIGAEYDRVFVKDHYMVEFLRSFVGHEAVHYLPEACNPVVHRSVTPTAAERTRFESDICTFGSLYYYRQALLAPLAGRRLKVWGKVPDWLVNRLGSSHMGGGVYEDDKCKAVGAAKIVLNTLHFGEINGLNCRAFEVPACGGFHMMSYSPAAAEHFEPEREIVLFRDARELAEKVDFYLAHPHERAEIALAGQRRAHNEHTYQRRLSRLLELSA